MGNYSRVYLFAGIVFIIVGIVIDKIVIFLPIGIALLVIFMLGIRRSRTLRNSDKEKRPE